MDENNGFANEFDISDLVTFGPNEEYKELFVDPEEQLVFVITTKRIIKIKRRII